jgi:DNA-binding beta-propeller fold protein YncE
MLRILTAVLVFIGLLALGFLYWQAKRAPEFVEIGALNVEGNAEIIDVSEDGQLLVFSNAARQSIGVVDLSNPVAPRLLGSVEVPGEPTSVAVSPDGQWALATVYADRPVDGEPPPDPRLPGLLAVISLRDPAAPELTSIIGIGHHPDSIALTSDGKELMAIIAIENEAVWVSDELVIKKPDANSVDISEPGLVQIVKLNPRNAYSWSVTGLPIAPDILSNALLINDSDPQPEYVALAPGRKMAAVSLQENNGILLIDLATPEIITAFSTDSVLDRPADLRADDVVEFTQQYPADATGQPLAGMRFPDAIAFSPDGQYLLSADEGEAPLTGGRGFSIWSLTGELVWSDDGQTEQQAAAAGFYPDSESAKRGIEIEGITAGRFGSRDFAFAVSEEGSFLAIYDISNVYAPEFVQILSTGSKPESVEAIPARNLVAVAAEGSGNISIYEYVPAEEQ